MGDRRFVNIRIEDMRQEVNIEMPGKEKLAELIPDLVKVLNPPQYLGRLEGVAYRLFHEGALLDTAKSLIELDIHNAETLILSLVETLSPDNDDDTAMARENVGEKTIPFITSPLTEAPSQRQQLTRHHIPIEEPSLVSISPVGWVFIIGPPPFTIGRPDKDFIPDMDLSEIDTRVRSSRRHAEIVMKKNRLAFVAHETTNGTFINGRKLTPEKPVLLKNSDIILFGRQGVKFVFRTPSKQETK